MKNFLDKTKNRLSIGGGKKSTSSSSSSSVTSTTTTTTTRYENGKPVEVITKTYTTEGNSPIENIEPGLPIEVLDGIKQPLEQSVKNPVGKPVEEPVKKSDKECDPDEPKLDESTVGYEGERSDPASQCSPVVDMDEFKKHLDLTGHDFSKVDKYARDTPDSQTKNSTQLSQYLTKPWNNDLDKLRCIFVWIAENIRYDTDAFFEGKMLHSGPEEVLRTRKAVCEGYAGLFDKLASDAGLKVWKISGKSKGAGFTPGCNIDSSQFDHAWNGVLYKGEFLLVDNTWGAGHINGRKFERHFEPFYFLCSPTLYIYSHFPEKPEHQYIVPKLTKQQFLDLPYVKPTFFTSGLRFVQQLGNTIEISDDKIMIEIERINPDESKPLHATLEWQGESLQVMIQRLSEPGPKGGRQYKLSSTTPSSGEGKLNIFVMLEGDSGPLVSSFKIKNSGSGKHHAPFVDTFSVPFSFAIQNPIHSKLRYKENVKFEVTIFDMSESELPSLALFLPEKVTRDLQKVSSTEDSYTFAIETCVDQKGKWALTYCSEPNSFNFIAQYVVE